MPGPARGASHGRILKLLEALMHGDVLNRHTAAQLANVNHEGAYRMLVALEQHIPGVLRRPSRPVEFYFDGPPVAEAGGLDSTRVGFATALAATFGSAFSKVFAGTDYETELRRQRDAVIKNLSDRKRLHFTDIGRKVHVLCGQEEVLSDGGHLLDEVLDAVLRQRIVRMEYQRFDGTTEHLEVRPYSLAVYDSHLYVVANGKHTLYYPYRFARIRAIEATGQRFEYPALTSYDPAQLFRHSIGVFVDPDPCDVAIRLDSTWRTYASHHRWHASQQAEQLDDGRVLLRLHVRPCKELEQWVLRFGDAAEVLAPLELRERIAARLRAAATKYSD